MREKPVDPRMPVLEDRQRRKEEFRTWFFLTVVMAPLLAVVIVAAFGFIVWITQMFVGPPTYH